MEGCGVDFGGFGRFVGGYVVVVLLTFDKKVRCLADVGRFGTGFWRNLGVVGRIVWICLGGRRICCDLCRIVKHCLNITFKKSLFLKCSSKRDCALGGEAHLEAQVPEETCS